MTEYKLLTNLKRGKGNWLKAGSLHAFSEAEAAELLAARSIAPVVIEAPAENAVDFAAALASKNETIEALEKRNAELQRQLDTLMAEKHPPGEFKVKTMERKARGGE